jgi:hypothetical protein
MIRALLRAIGVGRVKTISRAQDNRLNRVHAQVFGSFSNGEIKITMLPNHGQGGAVWGIPIGLVPMESRIPNSLLWVTFRLSDQEILNIEPRLAGDETAMTVAYPPFR